MIKTKRVIMRVLIVFISLVFLAEGITKLSAIQLHVDNFARWGYPWWMMYFVGTLELIGSILIHVKKLTRYVVLGFTVLMVIAVRIHLVNNEGLSAASIAIILLIAQTGILYLWWSLKKSETSSLTAGIDASIEKKNTPL